MASHRREKAGRHEIQQFELGQVRKLHDVDFERGRAKCMTLAVTRREERYTRRMEEKRKGNEVWADHRNLSAMGPPACSCTNLIHSLHGMHNDVNRIRTDARGIFKLLSGNCDRLFLDVAWVNTRTRRGRILMGSQTNVFGTCLCTESRQTYYMSRRDNFQSLTLSFL